MNKKTYENIIAFHPGYYLETLREDMGMTQKELAKRLDTTEKTISKLLNGHINLSKDIALNLSLMLGTGVDVWLNLQKSYDQKVLEIIKREKLDKEIKIAKTINYKYFVDMGLVPPSKDWEEKVSNLCSYLKVSSLSTFTEADFLVNFRASTNNITLKNQINSRIWLQTALNIGYEMETEDFNKNNLIDHLDEIRGMTVKDPAVFIPRLKKIFAESGVAFVLLPHLSNSGINGAVKWINKNKVVLAMNNRMKYADIFWFSLFHEIAHVLQMKIKSTIISAVTEEELCAIDEELENEADDFARESLISLKDYNKFINEKIFTESNIIKYSQEINIPPGILVGRMQKEKHIEYWQFSNLREKYEIE